MSKVDWQEFVLTGPRYTAKEVENWTEDEISKKLFGKLGLCQATPIGIYYGWFDEYVDRPSKSLPRNLFWVWDHLDDNDRLYHYRIEKDKYKEDKRTLRKVIEDLKKQKALENN